MGDAFGYILEVQDCADAGTIEIATRDLCRLGRRRPVLRDEIYAQLMKQLTDCPSEQCEAQLLKLAHRCIESFAPSSSFFYHVAFFMKSKSPAVHEALFRDD